MPIHLRFDRNKDKYYFQWGNQKKYYFDHSSQRSAKSAYNKVIKQVKAIYANKYK